MSQEGLQRIYSSLQKNYYWIGDLTNSLYISELNVNNLTK